ncbi:arabinogalactan oligomer/maltooligosaccharide transport system permease protein [Microbacterium ginsengiterrae]|uniref:Arabinogalactan oligomer/maltooligosaccharide transport system permease protein n=1 Tax=Microbacterium ginsengiterrae TaxID=546115 RepID=A0A7W9FCF6_9MICO|nr:sugar ABC transporter permease [Microbacterium ginsengiterrae]MBB5742169.1 arabinogalactan oligomer/maltooligosaccharide transport system permease protein [Microbacterium ginsengiterrae]
MTSVKDESTTAIVTRGSRRGEAAPAPRRPFKKYFRETGWRHIVGVVIGVFAIFPLLYVFSASLNPGGTLLTANALFSNFDFSSYASLFGSSRHPYGAWFMNTLLIGLITAFFTVILGALAAYSFSRMRFTGRRFSLTALLVVQMFPQMLAMVAIFLLMVRIGDIFPAIGLNSQIGLIMVYLGGALGANTYLMYGFFNTVPASIDEAAKIDGAGHARIFFTIILRLVAPILAVVGLLSFIGTCSEFVLASVILIDPDKQTLAVGLYKFVADEFSKNWSVFAAGAVLAAILPVALFLALQKYIVGGLTAGSVK